MTMHLEGPWLSTTGRKKSKRKHRTAESAAKARQNQESWAELMKKWGVEDQERRQKRGLAAPAMQKKPEPYRRDTGPRHPSLNSDLGNAFKSPEKVYTGDAMIGIGQLHKSNSVPVFKAEDAVDIAKMRRG